MEAVEKGSTARGEQTTSGNRRYYTAGLVLSGVVLAVFLVGAVVAVTDGIVLAKSDGFADSPEETSARDPLRGSSADFGGLKEDVEFEFPSSTSRSKRQAPLRCTSNVTEGVVPSAQIAGSKPPFYGGQITRTATSGWTPITGPGTNSMWQCRDRAFVRGGVYLDENEFLTVPVAGMYYVYAQVHFRSLKNYYYSQGTAILRRVCFGNFCYWKPLTMSYIKENTFDDSLFHAGIYRLEAGDKIGIQVIFNRVVPPNVMLTSIQTYYGLFLFDRTL